MARLVQDSLRILSAQRPAQTQNFSIRFADFETEPENFAETTITPGDICN